MGILRARKHNIAYRLMGGLPDAVFAVSDKVRCHCIDVDRIDPDRVLTVYNGLNLKDWNIGTRPNTHKKVVITVGNIRKVKGHDLLIQAAAKVIPQFPSVSFCIIGDILEPEYFEELQSLVRELDISQHISFLGEVADTKKYLAAADIFVLPSRSEGFSNAIVEAMAASLPVIASDVGGNAEAVSDGRSGVIVPPEDSSALAEAICRLLRSPTEAQRMGEAGRTLAAERFSTEAMMSIVVQTYVKLVPSLHTLAKQANLTA